MDKEKAKRKKEFRWRDVPKAIWYFLEEDKAKFAFSFTILLLIFFYDFVPTYVVGRMVDFFTVYKKGEPLTIFYFYAIFVGVTWIMSSLIRLYSKRTMNVIGQKARARARIWGFERLTEFSLEWHSNENTGSKLQKIFTGADSLNGWSKIIRKDLLKLFANIFGVIIFFSFVDFRFAIFVIIYTVIFGFVEIKFSKKVNDLANQLNQYNQSAGGVYMESANNMLAIKALGGEQGALGRVQDKEQFTRDVGIQKAYANNLKWRTLQFVNGIALGTFIWIVGMSVIDNVITIGMILTLYTYFFTKLQVALADLSDLHTDLIDLRSDLGQMMPIFEETEFIKTGNKHWVKDWKNIEFTNVTMDYGSGQIGLTNFNLQLRRGTKTGVAGLSGSGKSTLAKIILGLYGISSGSFKIGREGEMQDYYSISHKETLNNITVVLQETELFNLSLRDNITMMRGEDSKLLEKAVEISALGEVIARLPEGLDAKIGEKGYMLSGGERQRLGIARAIYKNAPIIILDEATSSLDSETEGKIMQKLLGSYGKDKTFLIIAHRLGTLRYTDNIAVMERGTVVEEGSYEKLMANTKSIFSRLNKEKKVKKPIEKLSNK